MTDSGFDAWDDDEEKDDKFVPMTERDIIFAIREKAEQLEYVMTGEAHRYPGVDYLNEILGIAVMITEKSDDRESYIEAFDGLGRTYIDLMELTYQENPALRRNIDFLKQEMIQFRKDLEFRKDLQLSPEDKEVRRYIRIQEPTPIFWHYGKKMMVDMKNNFSVENLLLDDYSHDPKMVDIWKDIPNPIKGFYWILFRKHFNDYRLYVEEYMDSLEHPQGYSNDDLDRYGF